MIVPMKKASLVVVVASREKALLDLRDIGVLHLESHTGSNERIGKLSERLSALRKAQRDLAALDRTEPATAQYETDHDASSARHHADELLERLQSLADREGRLAEEAERLRRERDRLALWGDFDPDDIRRLNDSGVPFRLYLLTRNEMKSLPAGATVFPVARYGSLTGVVCSDPEGLDGAVEFQLPSLGAKAIESRIEACSTELTEIAHERASLSSRIPLLLTEEGRVSEEIELEHAAITMGIEGELAHITGYVPEDHVDALKRRAAECGWALLLREPAADDPVPTLVRNPKAIRIINPVFRLLGTIPGYREHDISFFFLLFFSLFFAVIIGDAGYGFVFLSGTALSAAGTRRKGRPIADGQILLFVLSIATIIWGTITGTWFGSEAIASAPPFRWFVVESISSFNPRSGETVKYLCFIIGAVQIIIAHLWNFIAALSGKPKIRAFAQIGWIAMISGIYYLVLNLVLDPVAYPLPPFAIWLIAGGLAAVLLFAQQEGNFLKGVLKGFSGLLTTFLNSIGAFADVISYIRLFAVGLATVEIAKSFNAMAASGAGSVVGVIGAVVILALGHTLNLAMGGLSVIVHGVRLNMLEFSGHLGMEWTGIDYDPLRKKKETHTT